jgi:CubicO group peptidase (beta-lactamase class C family)
MLPPIRSAAAALAGAILLATPLAAQRSTPNLPLVAEQLDLLGAFGFSGAVLIAEDGRVVIRKGFDAGGPVDNRRTLFDIGSLAKQFTAAAIMALEADGRLTLGDSIGRFFPDAPADKRGITVEQLLTHTSGLGRGNLTTGEQPSELTPLTRDSAIARAMGAKLRFPPGTRQDYSNAGYVLLAAIVEVVSRQDFRDYLRTRLFQPAGLTDTRFWGEPAGTPVAAGRDELGIIFDPAQAPLENWSIRGSGAILSSIDDLERWMGALTSGRVLPVASVNRMMTAHAGINGYGWRIGNDSTYPGAVYHGGDYLGVGSQLLWYPAARRLIVILANVRDEDGTYPSRIRAERILLAALDSNVGRIPAVRRSRHAPPPTGDFRDDSGAVYRIATLDGRMVLGGANQRAVNRLWRPLPDTAAYWSALSDRTAGLLRAVLDKDTALVRRLLVPTDDPPYVYEQLVSELAAVVGNRSIREISALGTYPRASPRSLWTVAVLRSETDSVFYRLSWDPLGNVGSYHQRAPQVAGAVVLVASDGGWTGWNLTHGRPLVTLRTDPGEKNRLILGIEGKEVPVVRVER